MKDITYKNISTFEGKILTTITNKDKNWFTLADIYSSFPDLSKATLRVHLKNMVDGGLLMRIRDGVYYIIPFENDSETFIPDWHLLVEPLVGTEHYVGYYAAMHIHGIITQPSLIEQVVVNKQIKPSNITFRTVRFQMIYHNSKHFFGYKKQWVDNFTEVYCSDLEKTFIDSLYKPHYSCGILEIGKALHKAQKKLNFEKLLSYIDRFGSVSVVKRLGYLIELFDIQTKILQDLQNRNTKTVVLLDTELAKNGKINSRWGIQQNVDKNEITNSILT